MEIANADVIQAQRNSGFGSLAEGERQASPLDPVSTDQGSSGRTAFASGKSLWLLTSCPRIRRPLSRTRFQPGDVAVWIETASAH
jgi:hypothetical protein